jgi:hypothetical protein
MEYVSKAQLMAYSPMQIKRLGFKTAEKISDDIFGLDDKSLLEYLSADFEKQTYCRVSLDSEVIPIRKKISDGRFIGRQLIKVAKEVRLLQAQAEKRVGESNNYVSKDLLQFCRQQQEYNEEYLRNIKIVNKRTGKTTVLADMAKSPATRFSQMYVTLKGLEHKAKLLDYDFMLITLTAPPRFHPNPSVGRCKWDGSSAKDTHNYVMSLWANVKRTFANKGIKFNRGDAFGLRVSEPHLDGCPHYHILMFYKKRDQEIIRSTFKSYFSWSEKAIDFKMGDWEKGSPASYISKYISKNVSTASFTTTTKNENLEQVASADSAATERIAAWRSSVGIRAFQFFGINQCATKWNVIRSLRYLKGEVSAGFDNLIEIACRARDKEGESRFFEFMNLADDIIFIKDDVETMYGEEAKKVVAISYLGEEIRIEGRFEIIDEAMTLSETEERQIRIRRLVENDGRAVSNSCPSESSIITGEARPKEHEVSHG